MPIHEGDSAHWIHYGDRGDFKPDLAVVEM
ncbi:hypothetical protein IAD21_06155 [Abditibacteriota bacterium]|nr:hypothetical protein IAD21_06155 [Abditibacteriota bacterium]